METEIATKRRKLIAGYIAALGAVIVGLKDYIRDDPVPLHTRVMTGPQTYQHFLWHRHERVMKDKTRMSRDLFLALVNILKEEGGLVDGRKIEAGLKLMIFLDVLKGESVESVPLVVSFMK
jgi:hypothetical protein